VSQRSYDGNGLRVQKQVGSATPSTKWQFTSYERDAESGNDYAMMRSYVNRLARFSSPDLLAGAIQDPQSLHRFAYARNDSIDLVDPWGLDYDFFFGGCIIHVSTTESGSTASVRTCLDLIYRTVDYSRAGSGPGGCTLNIRVTNTAGVSQDILSGIEGRIAATFGNTDSPVAVDFGYEGTPDATLDVTNAGWFTNLVLGSPFGSEGGFWGSPSIYATNGPDNVNTSANLGSVGAHELAHDLLGVGDQPYDADAPNLMMYDSAPVPAQTAALLDPSSALWKLSSKQAAALLKKCRSLHPPKPG